MSSPVSPRSAEGTRILEELEKDEVVFLERKPSEARLVEGNGNVVVEVRSQSRNNRKKPGDATENEQDPRAERRDGETGRESSGLCCCCDEKSGSNNHKSLFSRMRYVTGRWTSSFESKDSPVQKPPRHVTKTLNKSNSVTGATVPAVPSRQNNSFSVCRRCNLPVQGFLGKAPGWEGKGIATVVELSPVDKQAMTLPKVRKWTDCKNKTWRTVFAKEKRSSASLEALPATLSETYLVKHRRNLSNPEGKCLSLKEPKCLDIQFREIEVRTKKQKPNIVVNPEVDGGDEDVVKVEIRRSSASMEDISKMTKQTEAVMLGSLEPKKPEERTHTGSLDSMLCEESSKSRKKPFFSSPAATKKSFPGLFSRFRSGMSIDSTRSNSNSDSLHDQGSQPQSGWISSLAASFRSKRQTPDVPVAPPHPQRSTSREEIK